MRKELEERLIAFAIGLTEASAGMKQNFISQHLSSQILRSGTSAALNYGEAQAAESKKDFIHKNSIVLKELRETHVNLKIMLGSGIITDFEKFNYLVDECNQLVSIFYRLVQTAKQNEVAK
ncbi:MAG: four helix bundle protein [Bacteroidales bacterium]|nr:four helix bundle protein [Bacteroidales bacterium]